MFNKNCMTNYLFLLSHVPLLRKCFHLENKDYLGILDNTIKPLSAAGVIKRKMWPQKSEGKFWNKHRIVPPYYASFSTVYGPSLKSLWFLHSSCIDRCIRSRVWSVPVYMWDGHPHRPAPTPALHASVVWQLASVSGQASITSLPVSYVLLSGGVCANGDAPASELASGLRLGNCGAGRLARLCLELSLPQGPENMEEDGFHLLLSWWQQ